MYKSKLKSDVEVTYNGQTFYVDLDVTAKLVDGSFSHGLGLQALREIEFVSSEIETVYDHEGDVVTRRELITAIQNVVDGSDHMDVFDFDDFEA